MDEERRTHFDAALVSDYQEGGGIKLADTDHVRGGGGGSPTWRSDIT